MLRHKFFSLLSGHIATREECEALLVPQEGTDKLPTRSTHRVRPSKHNMAKGALKPEDAAVSPRITKTGTSLTCFPVFQVKRLSEIIEKRAKELASQRQS